MNYKDYIPILLLISLIGIALLLFACNKDEPEPGYPNVEREDKIPTDVTKCGPDTDQHPPILHSAEFENPIPLPYPINTAGAEDSPFILADGNSLYIFFTPDVSVAPDKQLLDDVSGVWMSTKAGNSWGKPERVWLQTPGKLALDGAVAVQGTEMWFASAREGFTEVNMFTATMENNSWSHWQYCGDRLMKEIQIGEVHLHGNDLFFHSNRAGGMGDYDIWVTKRNGEDWSDPENIAAVNTSGMDGFPYVSSDGNQLWFTRTHLGTPGIFRSVKTAGNWGEPELILSQFAGEPSLDDAGNLYFTHHFYEENVMIEADIYVARRK